MTAAMPAAPRQDLGARPSTYWDALRSEWTKFRSVQSTYWTFMVAIVLGIGLAALVSGISANHYRTDPSVRFDWDPLQRSERPAWVLAQLAFTVLGVLMISSEYSSGMIRTSLAAVPKRVRMMSAKMVILAVSALIIGESIAFASFFLGQFLIHGEAPTVGIGGHGVLRVVFGTGLYLTLMGLLGSGVAVIVRNAAAGIAIVVGILFVLPGIAEALPNSWNQPIEKYWPTNAGQQITSVHRGAHTLGAWSGLLEFAVFNAIVIALSYFLLERRDA